MHILDDLLPHVTALDAVEDAHLERLHDGGRNNLAQDARCARSRQDEHEPEPRRVAREDREEGRQGAQREQVDLVQRDRQPRLGLLEAQERGQCRRLLR